MGASKQNSLWLSFLESREPKQPYKLVFDSETVSSGRPELAQQSRTVFIRDGEKFVDQLFEDSSSSSFSQLFGFDGEVYSECSNGWKTVTPDASPFVVDIEACF